MCPIFPLMYYSEKMLYRRVRGTKRAVRYSSSFKKKKTATVLLLLGSALAKVSIVVWYKENFLKNLSLKFRLISQNDLPLTFKRRH